MSDTTAFQDVVAALDTPVFVVTASVGGERSGCLVGFATQCSIEPPRFAVCMSKANHTFDVAMAAGVLVVHVLRAGDHALASRFGGETGDEVDKFAGLDLVAAPVPAPVLAGLDWFAGRVLDHVDLGDHVAVVLDPFGGEATRTARRQLGFQDVRDVDPGHPA